MWFPMLPLAGFSRKIEPRGYMCVYVCVHNSGCWQVLRSTWWTGKLETQECWCSSSSPKKSSTGIQKNHFPAHEANHDGTALPLLLIFDFFSSEVFLGLTVIFHLSGLLFPIFLMDKIFHPPKYFVYSYEYNGSVMKLPWLTFLLDCWAICDLQITINSETA